MNSSSVDFPHLNSERSYGQRDTRRKIVYILRRQGKKIGPSSPRYFLDINKQPIPGIIRRNFASDSWANAVAREHAVSDSHSHRIAAVLHFLMERARVKPQLTFLDGELSVEWRFGSESLELSIPDVDDEIYVRITDQRGAELKVAFLKQISEDEREVANRLSTLIEAGNEGT